MKKYLLSCGLLLSCASAQSMDSFSPSTGLIVAAVGFKSAYDFFAADVAAQAEEFEEELDNALDKKIAQRQKQYFVRNFTPKTWSRWCANATGFVTAAACLPVSFVVLHKDMKLQELQELNDRIHFTDDLQLPFYQIHPENPPVVNLERLLNCSLNLATGLIVVSGAIAYGLNYWHYSYFQKAKSGALKLNRPQEEFVQYVADTQEELPLEEDDIVQDDSQE